MARVTEISSAIMGEEEMAQRLTHTHTLALVPPRVAFVALHKANLLALANCLFSARYRAAIFPPSYPRYRRIFKRPTSPYRTEEA